MDERRLFQGGAFAVWLSPQDWARRRERIDPTPHVDNGPHAPETVASSSQRATHVARTKTRCIARGGRAPRRWGRDGEGVDSRWRPILGRRCIALGAQEDRQPARALREAAGDARHAGPRDCREGRGGGCQAYDVLRLPLAAPLSSQQGTRRRWTSATNRAPRRASSSATQTATNLQRLRARAPYRGRMAKR